MLPEQIITGRGESIFAKVKTSESYQEWKKEFKTGEMLSTYTVLNKSGYGYCEYLENKQEENTIKRKYLREYVLKLFLLNEFATTFGMSDLHFDNLFACFLCPLLTDLEVIMLPTDSERYATHLLDGSNAGLYWATPNEKGTNKVWISYGKGAPPQSDCSDCGEIRDEIRANYENSKEKKNIEAILKESHHEISQAKSILNQEKHRLVLIPTQDLSGLLKNWNKEGALKQFKEWLKTAINNWDAHLQDNIDQFINNQFLNDFNNNDVPIFHIDHLRNIYYGNRIIAQIN